MTPVARARSRFISVEVLYKARLPAPRGSMQSGPITATITVGNEALWGQIQAVLNAKFGAEFKTGAITVKQVNSKA